mmetsp:Transcript_74892/g.211839  ORF Transcript_74892/g.211839 Transcript_74892/m.211839 type:complete len:266 (-) Transcript_74892:957-1754(-)
MMRSKWTIRVADDLSELDFSDGETRKNHHSSNFGSGKSGACTGPTASFSLSCLRSICTVTVATSPTTISGSSSTSMLAFSSTSPTCEQKASMSASCCGSIVRKDLRCSESVSRNSASVVTLAVLHCSSVSSVKCGTCSSCELFTSSACTRHRRKSIMACAVANHSRMQAISIMACVTFMECLSRWSMSSRNSGVMRLCRRCMWAHVRYWFFMMIGKVKERLLCSTTCPASSCIWALSFGLVSMLLLSVHAAKSSGQALRRVFSLR